jgi:1,4-dihydroxy-2-naphthoate octaprenyltransferase
MQRIKAFVRITRAPFLTAVIVPTLLGAMIAWSDRRFHLGYLLLTLLGIMCVNIGLNLSNDYFDHLSGNDESNQELTPFSGGSRTIQNGILAPRQVLAGSVLFFALGALVGLYLAWVRGWPLLLVGFLGMFIAFFHNAPPVNLYRLAPGVGELAAGIGCGPLVVLGSYYVQAQRFSLAALSASIPMGLLISAVLYINEFPDYLADKAAGKKTLVVVLGRERAVWGYVALLAATYVTIVVGVLVRSLPWTALLGILSTPMAYLAIRGVMRDHDNTQKLISTNALTIQIHLLTGLLLCVGYAIAVWVP